MKLLDLLNEIEEKDNKKVVKEKELQEGFSIDNYEVKNELGKFFIVTKPKSKKTTLDDIVFESDVFHFANQIKGGLAFEDVVGIFKQKSDARREGTELLKAYETQIQEMETAVEEFRTMKKEIEEKRKAAAEKIKSLK
jgi:hypothetical protein